MHRKRSLIQIYLVSMIALAAIPVAINGSIWIATEYDRFTEQTQNLRTTFVDSRHELLRREVEKAVEYIDYKRTQLNRRLYQELRQEVAIGLALLDSVNRKAGADESHDVIIGRVRDVIEPLRFHDNKGFFFAFEGSGDAVLAPLHPDTRERLSHGRMLRSFALQIQEATRQDNQNFLEFRFTDQTADTPQVQRNISFVYYYKPLDLYLGASVYLRDEIERIQQEVIDRLSAIPYDPDSSVLFVTDLDGNQLVNPYNPETVGERFEPIARLFQTIGVDARDNQGKVLELNWQRKDGSGSAPALSFVREYADWGWVIGAGFFLDEFYELLEKERSQLESRVYQHTAFILFIALGLMVVAALVARRLATLNAMGFRSFQQFFAEASKRSTRIDVAELPFAEFEELAANANYMVEKRTETERALKLSERRFQLALDAAQNHLWDLDLGTGIMAVGAGLYRELGYQPPEKGFTIDQFSDLCHPNDVELLKEVLSNWQSQSTGISMEFRIRARSGDYHWMFTRGDIVETDSDGKPLRAMGIMSDITERKRMEDELVAARIAAEDANHAKSQFLSSVSHELRTPLNGVLGYAQLLQRQKDLPEESQSYLSAIESCGQHLLTLINDVLDLAKIESGNLNIAYAPVTTEEVLSSVGDIVRQRAQAKGLEYRELVDASVPARFNTDEVRLRQILVNLLDNAVKFTPQGFVELKLGMEDNGQRIRFVVNDSGMGIPRDRLQEIFEPFRRVNEHDGKGTGLGLAICRRLCEAMGGELSVRSELGKGTSFSFDIPMVEATVEYAPRVDDQKVKSLQRSQMVLPAGLSMIIADDNAVNREVLLGMLDNVAGKLREAGDGQQVLDLLAEESADLVLMDLRMPEMDGVEATRRIKADPRFADVLVIMISASAALETVTRCREAGADDFVAKPVQMEELMEVLAAHCGKARGTVEVLPAAPAPSLEDIREVGLPEPERKHLLELLAVGDIAAMDDYLKRLSSRYPASSLLVDSARTMLKNFDFDGLNAILRG